MLGSLEQVLLPGAPVVALGVVPVLLGVLQRLFRIAEGPAGRLGCGQIGLIVWRGPPVLSLDRQGAQGDLPGGLRPNQGLKLRFIGRDRGVQRVQLADHLGALRLHLVHVLPGHLAQLLAQAQLLQAPVQGGQAPLAVGGLLLQTNQGDVQGLTGGHHLIHRAVQLPDHIGVVRLDLALLQIVKGVPKGIVCVGQGAVIPAHDGDVPLGVGDVVELPPQILVHQIVVDPLDPADVLREHPGAQAPRPDPAVQIGPGHRPLRVRRELCFLLYLLGGAVRGSFLLALGGHRRPRQCAGRHHSGQQQGKCSSHGMILHFSHRSFVRFVSLSVFIIVSKGKLNVNKAGIPSVHTHCFPLRPSGALRQNHRRQKKRRKFTLGLPGSVTLNI